MTKIAIIPGSFDPVTRGHLDVIERAAGMFAEVRVLAVHNPDKRGLIDYADRVRLIEQSLAELDSAPQNVTVDSWSDGLLVDYARGLDAVFVKGLRSPADLAYETQMVLMNKSLAGIETVFLLANPAYALVSSSLVREVARLGGDVSEYVPDVVSRFLKTR